MAWARSSGDASVRRYPAAPSDRAVLTYSPLSKLVRMITGSDDQVERISRRSSIPSRPGIRMSTSATSCGVRERISTASSASEASVTSASLTTPRRTSARPLRTSVWSSTSRTFMGSRSSSRGHHDREVGGHPRAEAGTGLDAEPPADVADAPPEHLQTDVMGRTGSLLVTRREAVATVADDDREVPLGHGDAHVHVRGRGVLGGVRQRLPHDDVGDGERAPRHSSQVALHGDAGGELPSLDHVLDVGPERLGRLVLVVVTG